MRELWAFVMVLSSSRHMFVRPMLRIDAGAWVEAHVAAFCFFGAVPARLVPDDLRTGVDRPGLSDPSADVRAAPLALPRTSADGRRCSRLRRWLPERNGQGECERGFALAGAPGGRDRLDVVGVGQLTPAVR